MIQAESPCKQAGRFRSKANPIPMFQSCILLCLDTREGRRSTFSPDQLSGLTWSQRLRSVGVLWLLLWSPRGHEGATGPKDASSSLLERFCDDINVQLVFLNGTHYVRLCSRHMQRLRKSLPHLKAYRKTSKLIRISAMRRVRPKEHRGLCTRHTTRVRVRYASGAFDSFQNAPGIGLKKLVDGQSAR